MSRSANAGTLNDLCAKIRSLLAPDYPHVIEASPDYGPFRAGDIGHSLAEFPRRAGYLATNQPIASERDSGSRLNHQCTNTSSGHGVTPLTHVDRNVAPSSHELRSLFRGRFRASVVDAWGSARHAFERFRDK